MFLFKDKVDLNLWAKKTNPHRLDLLFHCLIQEVSTEVDLFPIASYFKCTMHSASEKNKWSVRKSNKTSTNLRSSSTTKLQQQVNSYCYTIQSGAVFTLTEFGVWGLVLENISQVGIFSLPQLHCSEWFQAKLIWK